MCRCRCSCLMFFSILYLLQSCNKDLDSHDAKSLVSYNTNLYSVSSKWENFTDCVKSLKNVFSSLETHQTFSCHLWHSKPSHLFIGIRLAKLPNLISCFPLSLLCNHCFFSSFFFFLLFFLFFPSLLCFVAFHSPLSISIRFLSFRN